MRVLALAALVAFGGAGCTKEMRIDHHVQRGDKYFKTGEYDRSLYHYLAVLPLNPQHVGALRGAGFIYAQQGRADKVCQYLGQAAAADPKDLTVRTKLATAALATRQYRLAASEALFVLERAPLDEDALIALVESAQGKAELAQVHQRLEALRAKAGEQAVLHAAEGYLLARQANLSGAEAELKRALQLNPKSAMAQAGLGGLYTLQNKATLAEPCLAAAIELEPKRADRRLRWLEAKARQNPDEAAKAAEKLCDSFHYYVPLWLFRAQLALQTSRMSDCVRMLKETLQRDPDNFEARTLIARIRIVRGELAQAVIELEDLCKKYPQTSQAYHQLGLAYLAKRELPKAAENFNKALALEPDATDPVMMLAETRFRQGFVDDAEKILLGVIQKHPQTPAPYYMLADAYRSRNKLEEAAGMFNQIMRISPKDPRAPFQLGLVRRQQKKTAEARAALEQAYAIAPADLTPLAQLIDLDVTDKQFAAAHQRLQKEIAKQPKSSMLRYMVAELYFTQKDFANAAKVAQETLELSPENPSAYMLQARISLAQNQPAEAVDKLKAAASKSPKNAQLLGLIGSVLLQNKDYANALEYFQKVLALNAHDRVALNNAAYILSEHLGKLDQALELAKRASETYPQDAAVADTYGWVLVRRGDYAQALTLLRSSAARLPMSADVQYHLGVAHYLVGEEEPARVSLQKALELDKNLPQRADAEKRLAILQAKPDVKDPRVRELLEQALKAQPRDAVAMARLAGVYVQQGQPQQAVALYEELVKANPKSMTALIQLAGVYEKTGRRDKALETAMNIRSLSPDDPRMWQQAGRLALRNGDLKWAYSQLREAANALPEDAEATFDAALAGYCLGNLEEAAVGLQKVFKAPTATPARKASADHALRAIQYWRNPAQIAAAAAEITKLVASDPASLPCQVLAAQLLEKQGQYQAAQQAYAKLIEFFPGMIPAMRNYTVVGVDFLKETKKPYELGKVVFAVLPQDLELAAAFGKAAYQEQDMLSAAQALQVVARDRSRDADILYRLALAQVKTGNKTDGKDNLKKALALAPAHPLASEAKAALSKL